MLAYRALGAHAVVWGGPTLPPSSDCAWRLRAASLGYPPPSLPRARYMRCWGGGVPFYSWSWPRGWGLRCHLWGSPPWSLAARCRCTLLGGGTPPSFPPFACARVKCARPFRGVLFPRLRRLSFCTQEACCRVFPLPPAPSRLGPLWPRGRPRSLGLPHRLGRLPSLSALKSCTRGALARRSQPGAIGAGSMPR